MANLSSHYWLPDDCARELDEVAVTDSFFEVYDHIVEVFMKPPKKKSSLNPVDTSLVGRWLLTIDEGSYIGRLWDDPRISFIGPSNFLLTVPAWEWWVEPFFPRAVFMKTAHPVVVTKPIARSEVEDLTRLLLSEDRGVTNSYALTSAGETTSRQASDFLCMMEEVLPTKLAYDVKRLATLIRTYDSSDIFFVLRGGRFIRDVLQIQSPHTFLPGIQQQGRERYSGDVSLVIDDCIGTGRTLDHVCRLLSYSTMVFSSLDATLPRAVYQRRFPSVVCLTPDVMLNLYGCRLFEGNEGMIGYDVPDTVVRRGLVDKIIMLSRHDDDSLRCDLMRGVAEVLR